MTGFIWTHTNAEVAVAVKDRLRLQFVGNCSHTILEEFCILYPIKLIYLVRYRKLDFGLCNNLWAADDQVSMWAWLKTSIFPTRPIDPVKWVPVLYIEYQSYCAVVWFGATRPVPHKRVLASYVHTESRKTEGGSMHRKWGGGGPKSYDSTETLVLYINDLCTYNLYGPVRNVFVADRSIIWASGRASSW